MKAIRGKHPREERAMSDGLMHRRVGFVAGGATAWCAASGQPTHLRVVETIGGAMAGIVGAVMPDRLDPPTSPLHRSIGHGLVPIGAAGFWAIRNLKKWQRWLREQAQRFQQELNAETDGGRRILLMLAMVACTLAAGAVAGFIGGYISHVALDALTPASLPVIG